MKRSLILFGIVWLMLVFISSAAYAQRPFRRPPNRSNKSKQETPPPRPTDPRLIDLHREFLTKTEKLAAEYEKKNEPEKAREAWEAILRLMPKYEKAELSIQRIVQQEATKDRKQLKVLANKSWQDTGVVLLAGKPVHIEAQGTWEMVMHTGPDGFEIPREYRDFKLAALVGVIATGGDPKKYKPFLVGSKKNFVVEETGRLFLRIYDMDPSDNDGRLDVLIQSTFAKTK